MQSRGNALKLTAVATLVVLALTGFSTGRSRGGGGKGGGGGGCSSSSQDHDSSRKSGGGSHRDRYDDDEYGYGDHYGSSSGSSGSNGTDTGGGSPSSSLQDATVELLSCASKKAPYATVRVTNPNAVDGVFSVVVDFEDRAGRAVASSAQQVTVAADGTTTARVKVGGDRRRAARVSVCDPDRYAPATR
ncbi:hypothetical protein [Streptomyces sp. NPDC055186]